MRNGDLPYLPEVPSPCLYGKGSPSRTDSALKAQRILLSYALKPEQFPVWYG